LGGDKRRMVVKGQSRKKCKNLSKRKKKKFKSKRVGRYGSTDQALA
jgi:hypothetical protein